MDNLEKKTSFLSDNLSVKKNVTIHQGKLFSNDLF